MAITADEAKRYAAVAGDALTAERVALRRTEEERDEARAEVGRARVVVEQADTERRYAQTQTNAVRAERDAALAQVEALRTFLRNETHGECFGRQEQEDYCLDCSTLHPDNPCFCCRTREVLSSHPSPAVYTRERLQEAIDAVPHSLVDGGAWAFFWAALDAHPGAEVKP